MSYSWFRLLPATNKVQIVRFTLVLLHVKHFWWFNWIPIHKCCSCSSVQKKVMLCYFCQHTLHSIIALHSTQTCCDYIMSNYVLHMLNHQFKKHHHTMSLQLKYFCTWVMHLVLMQTAADLSKTTQVWQHPQKCADSRQYLTCRTDNRWKIEAWDLNRNSWQNWEVHTYVCSHDDQLKKVAWIGLYHYNMNTIMFVDIICLFLSVCQIITVIMYIIYACVPKCGVGQVVCEWHLKYNA